MASRSGSCRATSAVGPGSRSHKIAASAPLVSMSNSKSDELEAPEKGTSTPSHASAPNHVSAPSHMSALASVEPTLALKYSKADLMGSWTFFQRSKVKNQKLRSPASDPWRLRFLMYISKSCTWIATTSASSARIISRQLVSLDQTVPRSWHYSFVERAIFGGINIGNNSRESPYSRKSLKSSLERILETIGSLWILSEVISNGTLSTN